MVARSTAGRRRSQGLCECGERPAEGFKFCQRCMVRNRERTRRHSKKKKASGRCQCGQPLTNGKSACDRCRDRRDKRRAARIVSGHCIICGRKARPERRTCERCGKTLSAKVRRAKLRLKREVFEAYGGCRCACCGETTFEFLSIDHVDGGGTRHRKTLGEKSSRTLYLWLRRNNFPPGYRVLCFNCNCSRGFNGYCPHERERQSDAFAGASAGMVMG